MDLGVLEGQTRGDYFLNSIFDPSVKQCSVHFSSLSFVQLTAIVMALKKLFKGSEGFVYTLMTWKQLA